VNFMMRQVSTNEDSSLSSFEESVDVKPDTLPFQESIPVRA
jgi:hypothetical protein